MKGLFVFNKYIILTLLLVSSFNSKNLWGQEYLAKIIHFTTEDGLSHREVNGINEDCNGFIWLATKQGLNRFDGYKFEEWTKEKDGLLTNHIGDLVEDAKCNFWLIPFGYQGGDISIFNHHTQKITTLKEQYGDELPFPVENVAYKILSTQTKHIILGNRFDGQMVSIDSSGVIRSYDLPFKSFFPVEASRRNTIFGIADQTTLLEVDLEGNILQQHFIEEGISYKSLKFDIHSMPYFFDSNYKNYCIDKGGTFKEIKNGEFPIPNGWEGRVRGLLPLDEKNEVYWVYNEGGSTLVPTNNELFLLIKGSEVYYDLGNAHPDIIGSGVRAVFVDSVKRTWIGGNFGVWLVEVNPNKFTTYLKDFKSENMNSSLSCRGILRSGNDLYVNFETNGLCKVDLETKMPERKLFEPSKAINWTCGIEKDATGKIWVGGLGKLFSYNPQTEEKTAYQLGKKGGIELVAWELFFDGNDQLWIGTQRGLMCMQGDGAKIEAFKDYNEFETLRESTILYIGKIANGNLLICSNTGLYELDPQKGIIARYWTGGEGKYSLPHDNIQHFYRDDEGVFWLSSGGGGLIKWDKENGTATSFGRSQGLSNEVIYAVYPDKYDNLWMGSDYGIIRFNKKTHNSKAFMPADGTSHHEFNRVSHYQDEEGKIYFGSLNGVTEIDPEKFKESQFNIKLQLRVTSFQQLDGKSDSLVNRTQELLDQKQIVVKPGDGFFRVEFSLFNYMDMDRVRYAYKLEGVDPDWIYQKENNIRLSGLPYGEHILRVKGQTPTGQWSTRELAIPVVVLKPFYLKWWFVGASFLFILILGPTIYFWQMRKYKNRQIKLEVLVNERTLQIQEDKKTIEEQAKKLLQLDQMKSRFFANVSHELRTPLTLMLGPIGSVLKSAHLKEKDFKFLKMAQSSGKNLLHLVNEILDLSKIESGKLALNEEPVKILPYLKRLFIQYESYADQKGVGMAFKYSGANELRLMLDTNKVEKIFNNFLSNALKFTKKGDKIEVSFIDKGGKVWLQVADTGAGIHEEDLPNVFNRFYQSKQSNAPTQGGTGIGLALCLELAKTHNGNVWAESKWGEGSVFTFEFPKKVYEENSSFENVEPAITEIEAEIAPAEIIPLPSEGKKSSLLVVEDNQQLRAYIKQILTPYYRVETAINGSEALRFLNGELVSKTGLTGDKIDLILSDVMMPVMDGFELLKQLKSNEKWSNTPVVMLTARTALQDKLTALRIGVDDYMLKPFEEEELLARVANLLKNHRERIKSVEEIPEKEKFKGISGEDKEWLIQLEDFVQKEAGTFNLTAEMLASEMALSRTQLFRRIKLLTGLTPTQYVQEVRFSQAREFLENKRYSTVKAVAYEVGFKQVKHFSQQFKKRYGKSPSEYL